MDDHFLYAIGPDGTERMTPEMIAATDAYNERRKRMTTQQAPIQVRREYIEPNYEPHPLYTATRIHVAELWLESRK